MTSKTLALLLLGLVVPGICSAQTHIKTGTWTGTVVPPDGGEVALTYTVTDSASVIGIVLNAGEHGSFTTTEASYDGKVIKFTFSPGPEVHCSLTLNEQGEYAGDCLGNDGSVASMKMVPPKEG